MQRNKMRENKRTKIPDFASISISITFFFSFYFLMLIDQSPSSAFLIIVRLPLCCIESSKKNICTSFHTFVRLPLRNSTQVVW